jgi:hypothetical protein
VVAWFGWKGFSVVNPVDVKKKALPEII